MPLKITRCDLLRIQRHELLKALTDEAAYMRERRYLRELIHRRLGEIRKEMTDVGCPTEPDEGQYMDLEREWEEELQRLQAEDTEEE
jgi:hypothetical protein